MIDPSVISKIIDTADILDVVQDFVALKKRGANFVGLCPFHNEKTPSFNVSPSRGIYKCFGCGKGGNAVNFVMEHERFSYYEALRYIAKKYNIEIVEREMTDKDVQQKNEIESLLLVTSYAQTYFSDILNNNMEGIAIGMAYFKERGFKEAIIEKFQLGYCLEKKDDFTQTALKNGYKTDYLVKTGLTIQRDNQYFDRFNARVIFPIHSLSGRVIAFGGRILKKNEKTAKYINSPESEIYYKSRVLYGIYFARQSMAKENKCFLVEGYTDVISLFQAGVENVVASSGTSLTSDQIRMIKRFTKNITILYDGDEAGIKASLRGIDMILEEGMNVRAVLFPNGEDPDSFARHHSSSEITDYIRQNEKDFIAFKSQLLLKETGNDPILRSRLIAEIVQSISIIPDRITRAVYIKECSAVLDIEEHILYSEINKYRRKKFNELHSKDIRKDSRAYSYEPPVGRSTLPSIPSFIKDIYCEPQEKEIIRILLQYGAIQLYPVDEPKEDESTQITVAQYIINEIRSDELEFKNLVYLQIFKEYEQFIEKGIVPNHKYFTNHPDEEISRLVIDLLSISYDLSKIWKKFENYLETEEMKLKQLIPETLIAYKIKVLEVAQKEKQEQLKVAQTNNLPFEEITLLQNDVAVISNKITEISKIKGWVVLK